MAIKTRKNLFFLSLILCISTVFAMKNNTEEYAKNENRIASYECGVPQCPFPGCGLTFENVNDLLDHMRKKHADRKANKCNFPNCTKKSDSWSHLKDHMNCHLAEKYFYCPVCLKKFKWLKHLRSHLKEYTVTNNSAPVPTYPIQQKSSNQDNTNNDDFVFHLSETLLQEDSEDDLEIPEDLENLECLQETELELFLEQCDDNENSDS